MKCLHTRAALALNGGAGPATTSYLSGCTGTLLLRRRRRRQEGGELTCARAAAAAAARTGCLLLLVVVALPLHDRVGALLHLRRAER